MKTNRRKLLFTMMVILALATVCNHDEPLGRKAPITNIAVKVSAPIKDRAPAQTATCDNANVTVHTVSWNDSPSVFRSGTPYTVTITLTAKKGRFDNSLSATINGKSAAVATNSDETATITRTFPPTLTKDITGMALASSPKLNYSHEETLDLSGLALTLTFNNNPQDTLPVGFALFDDYAIEINFDNGIKLSHTEHNNKPIIVSYPGLPDIYTKVLTVVIRYPAYEGLVMAGYQGWFNAQGDGAGHGWRHYDFRDANNNDPRTCTIDFWPDMTEYTQKYEVPTKWFKMNNGSPAYLYSPYDEESVDLHFKWMQDYGIDGVWMQRFVGEIKGSRKAHFNKVLDSALKAAKKYDRAIGVMYDLSGSSSSDLSGALESDWAELQKLFKLNDLAVNPTYIHHNGKPLLAIWGVGFNDNRRYSTADVQATVSRLKSDYSIMLGVPYWWSTNGGDTDGTPAFYRLMEDADVIMPWAVGRYSRIEEYNNEGHVNERVNGIQWCEEHHVTYVPLVFPGFSWANMITAANFASRYNQISRRRGDFLWGQIAGAKELGAKSLYVAMFDEIDEGTAIFKCAVEGSGSDLNNLPIFSNPYRDGEKFIGIDADLGSDYYLWLVGQGANWFHGQSGYNEAKPVR